MSDFRHWNAWELIPRRFACDRFMANYCPQLKVDYAFLTWPCGRVAFPASPCALLGGRTAGEQAVLVIESKLVSIHDNTACLSTPSAL